MTIKDKIIECVAINLSKEKYGNSSKSDEFLIEAELLLKNLLLNVLIEKAKGDPLQYVECLENFKEILVTVLNCGVKKVIPHVYSSIIDKESGNTRIEDVRKLLSIIKEVA